jgi:HSP20 family protein
MIRITTLQAQWWTLRGFPPGYAGALPFSPRHASLWQPAVNAFRCGKALRICVDLAGVDRSEIELIVETRRLSIRGVRTAPEPACEDDASRQILALEIDSGPFARELTLPVEVKVDEVTATQREGLLWIELPIAGA